MHGEEQSKDTFSESPQSQPANGATAASGATQTSSDDLSKETQRLNQEIAELKDKYVRVYAEMENIRRRQERERGDLIKYALEGVFKDLLPVLDSLEKALPEGGRTADNEGSSASYLDGMMMIKKQLLEVCRKHGLDAIDAQQVPFDPNLHQAIQRVESADVQAETVGSEFARGYLLNGRLLRPAMVSVLIPSGS